MLNRRTFLQWGSLSTTALLLQSLDTFAVTPSNLAFKSATPFQLKIMATNWGFKGSAMDFCAKAATAGYDGVEIWWSQDSLVQQEWFNALKQYHLEVGFLCGGHQSTWKEHFNSFSESLKAATHHPNFRPLYINCHSGKDYFSMEDNLKFLELTTQVQQETGIPIYHETHRGRMLFAAHIAKKFIENHPPLQLTLDISHWCNVHESLLQDQQEAVGLALAHTSHIHSRIGHAEGPQVPDPRAPEWDREVQAHFNWWDKVMERKKKAGGVMTVLTEFGPPNYMWTQPFTKEVLSDQWAINVHMMEVFRKRYQF